MLVANATQNTTSSACARRNRGQHLWRMVSQRRAPSVPLHLCAVFVLLSFLAFVATSSPHRVHHLPDSIIFAESEPSIHEGHHGHRHDHAGAHTGQPTEHRPEPPTSQSPDCVVLFLLQSTALHSAESKAISAPIELQPLDVLAQRFRPLEAPIHLFQARAPPLISYFS